jgi:two-component system cell cycle sensor histidine kinase/response regulator CckA
LEHVPIPTYIFRVVDDDFVLEGLNAVGRAQNPALATMTGRSITHLYRDQPQALEDAKRAVNERTTVVREMAIRRHDRTEATQFVRLSYVFFAPGHLIIFVHDITTPPIAEAALRESEARYRSLVDALPDGVFLRGADGRLLACNDVALRLVGAKSQFDLLGGTDVLAPGYEVRTEAGERIEDRGLPGLRVLTTGEPEVGAVVSLKASDGSSKWLRVAAQPIWSSTGAITGSVTTLTDITERVSTQRALRASSARLDLALAAARMGIWEFDPVTDLGYWSDNLDSIFQLGPHGPGLASFLEWVHPDDRDAFVSNAQRTMFAAEGDSFESEFRLIGRDQVIRWARAHGRASRESGHTSLAGTVRDVTEQHRLEEELRRAHRLESIGRLAGGIAHDFNNLLAAMMGSLELLEEHCPPTAREDLGTIRHCTARARDLTRQLLAFARKQPAAYQNIDLSAMVSEVERMLERLVGTEIELVISSSDRVHVRADPSLIEQVLVNLVVNAREAMPNGGLVEVRVGRTFHSVTGGGDASEFAQIEVSDSGKGMDEETRSKIFDPFFTTKTSGTGLGLASSYGIVNQHGGHIVVETQPGSGTRFRVLLPLLHGAQAQKGIGDPAQARPGKGCILVVDDEELVRNTAVRMLRSLGYEVLSAASGGEAIERARRHPGPIRLVLCDVAMPGQDGPAVARELQKLRPELKVLFASGYAAEPDDEHLHGSVFLAKPYTRTELVAKLHELLEG